MAALARLLKVTVEKRRWPLPRVLPRWLGVERCRFEAGDDGLRLRFRPASVHDVLPAPVPAFSASTNRTQLHALGTASLLAKASRKLPGTEKNLQGCKHDPAQLPVLTTQTERAGISTEVGSGRVS